MSTLFNPSALAEAFPAAAEAGNIDVNPHRAPYEGLSERFRASQAALGIAATQGASVETGRQIDHLMNEPAEDVYDVLSSIAALRTPEGKAFTERVRETHELTKAMFEATGSIFSIPELKSPELKNIDWPRLHEAQEIYKGLGIKSRVIFTAVGRELEGDESWTAFFSGLREWQDTNHPEAEHVLKNQNDGDGLWIWDSVKTNWQEAIQKDRGSGLRWAVSVMPIEDAPINVSIDHSGKAADTNQNGAVTREYVPDELAGVISSLPKQPDGRAYALTHPRAETLMTAIALQIFENSTLEARGEDQITPIDKNTVTWAEQTIGNGSSALHVYWLPDRGQVRLHDREVGRRNGVLGGRPEVRG